MAYQQDNGQQFGQGPESLFSNEKYSQLWELWKLLDDDLNLVDDDPDFCRELKQSGGLLGVRESSSRILQYSQRLCSNPAVPTDSLSYIVQRQVLITFLLFCSPIESLGRLLMSDLPHLCAKAIVKLQFEMFLRADTLWREYCV